MVVGGGYISVWKGGYILASIWSNINEMCTKSVRIAHHMLRFEPKSDKTQVRNNIFLRLKNITLHFVCNNQSLVTVIVN